MIRRATVADVPVMSKIINDCAEYGLMLPRSLASLYENVREFHVATLVDGDAGVPTPRSRGELSADRAPAALGGTAAVPGGSRGAGADPETDFSHDTGIGVCGLSIVWADLSAVDPAHRGKGIGKRLVEACLAEAEQLRLRRVMTLTYEQAFFERLGFRVVDRQHLPLKVWSECVRCPKNQHCDEIAMIRVLEHVPAVEAPTATVPPEDEYIVPTVSSGRATRGPGSG